MNYNVLIQNRKSIRAFRDVPVPEKLLEQLMQYYEKSARRLIPQIATELRIFGTGAREALEGTAGYHKFLVGAPRYLVLLSEDHPQAGLNAGFLMEDLVLKLTDLELDSCWLTFVDSEEVKKALDIRSELHVAAIVAFGCGQRTTRRLRLNIKSMSNIDVTVKRQFFEPKRSVRGLVHKDVWGNRDGLNEIVGFYDDMLWEAFYAVSQAPSYLNRQAYGFLLRQGQVILVSEPDVYNTVIDSALSLGIALHHFTVVAESFAGKVEWNFDPQGVELPQGHKAIASAVI